MSPGKEIVWKILQVDDRGESYELLDAMAIEVDRLLAKNSELHRRAQQAEAAVRDFKKQWDKAGA